jgi:hypothetical protein
MAQANKKRKVPENQEGNAVASDNPFIKPPQGRDYTVSIAVPGSIVEHAQCAELRTYLVGQIARACAMFHVDEIVIFREPKPKGLTQSGSGSHQYQVPKEEHGKKARHDGDGTHFTGANIKGEDFDGNLFTLHVLQYLETPQVWVPEYFFLHSFFFTLVLPVVVHHTLSRFYVCWKFLCSSLSILRHLIECFWGFLFLKVQYLRKSLFPVHKDLKFAGLLNPLDTPHHPRARDQPPFREGVVVQRPCSDGQFALAHFIYYYFCIKLNLHHHNTSTQFICSTMILFIYFDHSHQNRKLGQHWHQQRRSHFEKA